MLTFDGEVQAHVAEGGVWIEINNPDPVDGALEWALVSTADARKLISEIQACLSDLEAALNTPDKER